MNAYTSCGNPVIVPENVAPSRLGVYKWTGVTKCGRCGGAGSSPAWAYTGSVCYDCGGSGRGTGSFTAYTADGLAKHLARKAKSIAKANAKAAAVIAAGNKQMIDATGFTGAQVRDMDMWLNRGFDRGFISDITFKANKYDLTEKQVAALRAVVDRVVASMDEATFLPLVLPTGKRVTLNGAIVSTKTVESQYGSTLKCLVVVKVDGAVAKIWMTCPSGDYSDDNVTFAVTLEAGSEAGFYFGSRPKVKEAAVA